MEIEPERAQILYLETELAMLTPPLRHGEFATMRWNFGRTLTLVRQMLPKRGSLLIHSHGRVAGLHSRLCRILHGKRVKIVHSFHGVASYKPMKRWFTLVIESILSLATDALVCDSESERQAFGRLPVFSKLVVIPPFYDQANVVEHARRAVKRIGFASRFDFPKLHEDLIRLVAAHNQNSENQLELIFCGDGPRRERVDQLGTALLGPRYKSLGHIEHIRNFYCEIDAYAHFSRYEGMPIGLIEAMASGLPSIATDVIGCRDAIRHEETGLLVRLDNLSDGLAALERLTDPVTAERLGNAAKQYAKNSFSKRSFLSRHIELYRQIGLVIQQW